jgi:small subunit ribosomal protein S2
MLTNFQTVFKRLQRLKELEELDFDDVAGSGMTKKELLQLRRERDKLERSLGGIRDMARVPSAIWVVDTKKEHIAVSEARKLGIPVIAILDTNCDPDEVTYPIPGNDDAIRSVSLLTRVIADAVADGLIARAGAADGEAKPAPTSGDIGAEEPLAEWELAVLEGKAGDDAAAQVPDTQAPEAQALDTQAPEAQAPDTQAPEAQAPEAQAPEAQAPDTQAPDTQAAETQAPEPEVPEAQNSEAPAAGETNGTAPEQGDAPAPEPEAAGVSAGSGESHEA